MGRWITNKGSFIQSNYYNKIITLTNQVYLDDDNTLYLVPCNTLTDNYTIPLGINKDKYDSRPSHLHDIGCKYHKFIIIDLPLKELEEKYIRVVKGKVYCKRIDTKYLKVVDTTFNKCNNILYNSMVDTNNIPKYICKLYRLGVNCNLNWLFTGKENIEVDKLYNNVLSTV